MPSDHYRGWKLIYTHEGDMSWYVTATREGTRNLIASGTDPLDCWEAMQDLIDAWWANQQVEGS